MAVNLALTAFLEGQKVMLADIDPQRSATHALRARKDPGPAFTEGCAGKLFHAKSAAMRDGFDLLIIDTPTAPESDVAQAINLSDLCLVVGRPSFLDLAPIVRSADAVRQLGRAGMIILNQAHTNRAEVAPVAYPNVIDALKLCGLPLSPFGLRSREAFQSAIAQGQSVSEWRPGGPADQDLQRLWAHVKATLKAAPIALEPVELRARAS